MQLVVNKHGSISSSIISIFLPLMSVALVHMGCCCRITKDWVGSEQQKFVFRCSECCKAQDQSFDCFCDCFLVHRECLLSVSSYGGDGKQLQGIFFFFIFNPTVPQTQGYPPSILFLSFSLLCFLQDIFLRALISFVGYLFSGCNHSQRFCLLISSGQKLGFNMQKLKKRHNILCT